MAALADNLLAPMDFSIFYDNRAQTDCNTNASLPGNQPTGQQYGGYYVGQGPAGYHNGALYSDPRISMYIGMGLHADARRCLVADLADAAAPALPDRPGLLLAGPVADAGLLADLHRPAVRQACSPSGRATTCTRARR